MAKNSKKVVTNGVKAFKNDIVIHNGQEWKVMSREFDGNQSYYELKNGTGRDATWKWARSDRFAVA